MHFNTIKGILRLSYSQEDVGLINLLHNLTSANPIVDIIYC